MSEPSHDFLQKKNIPKPTTPFWKKKSETVHTDSVKNAVHTFNACMNNACIDTNQFQYLCVYMEQSLLAMLPLLVHTSGPVFEMAASISVTS